MKYKVHKVLVRRNNDQEILESFLNSVKGDIVSITAHTEPKFMLMGGTSQTNYYLVVVREGTRD